MTALIYNVTVKISPEVHTSWVAWMLNDHIPDVMSTACFSSFRFLHLEGYDDEEGFTYAIQYSCPSRELLQIYQQEHALAMQQKHKALYEGKFVAFRTTLNLLAEG